jgi:hypothetical protein
LKKCNKKGNSQNCELPFFYLLGLLEEFIPDRITAVTISVAPISKVMEKTSILIAIETHALITALSGEVTETKTGFKWVRAVFLSSHPSPTVTIAKQIANIKWIALKEKRNCSTGTPFILIAFKQIAKITDSIK